MTVQCGGRQVAWCETSGPSLIMATGATKTQNGLDTPGDGDYFGTLSSDKEKGHIQNNTPSSQPVSKLRRALPQCLAAFAKNLLLVDLGMVIAFPTIVIPPLLESKEELRFTQSEASWFGSIVYFCQPLGSLTAAVTLEYLGRKRSMVFLNLPFFICWIALYFTQTVSFLFILSGIMGLTVGSIEASILSYVGEISEPSLRGTLTSLAEIAEYIGFVFMFFLGTVTDWRNSALISSVVPIISCLAILQIPETPIWLLSRGRKEDAIKSLCWLRGWVTPDQVQSEFDEIVRYSKASKMTTTLPLKNSKHSYANEISLSDEISTAKNQIPDVTTTSTDGITAVNLKHDSQKLNMNDSPTGMNTAPVVTPVERNLTFKEKVKDFRRREMMMPMFLVTSFFFFTYGSGMLAIRPYMVPVFQSLGIIMDPFLATTVFTAIGLGGCVVCTVTVRWVGKRPLALISVFGCGVSCLSLGAYAFYIYDLHGQKHPWIPMVLMVSLAFFTGIGMDPLPWMYLSEVFPFRGRSFACGVSAGISYVFGFIATKTFLVLENELTLAGVFVLYGAFSVVGLIYFYFYLPETEGRPMEDIEESFKKDKKREKM